MTVYTISRAFNTSVPRSERVMDVAESFGLGLSDKKFVIYDNLEVDIRQGDIVFITGQSGSGKSLLLRDLEEKMKADGLKVADLNKIELDDRPVIDQVGATTVEATELLAKAGISDAWIYLRRPNELSDGQRYRLKLAKVLDSGADVWIADEFGAILDRVTAKAVAFSMAKVAKRAGKTFMVATTHDDMVEELAPDVFIRKMFKDRVQIIADRDEETV